MSNKQVEEKISKEELKKLEDEAYFELCQIIAEALQLQDIELLDIRIATWKKKYKKLLDSPYSSNFKKRIEFLLNEYYSNVTQYILQQLKKTEHKKIEKQYKAMRKLRTILDENKDLKTLREKIKEWKEKYPVDAFLRMYQKKINLLTSEKNLKEIALDQEQAFYELYYITKKTGTLEELKKEVEKWKEKYRIGKKFKIDDFKSKYLSDVKRYTSDEYLDSIARHDEEPTENQNENIEPPKQIVDDISLSDISVQDRAYKKLLNIMTQKNNINEVFDWVYKNSSIKFNDKYKELILAATYLEYSPTYLTRIKPPAISILDKSLSFDEYKNISDIKRYAIISYFNLLLPKEQAISNNYFDNYVKEIHYKSTQKKEYIKASMETAMRFRYRNSITKKS